MKRYLILLAATTLFATQMVIYQNQAFVSEDRSVKDGVIAPLPKRIVVDSIYLGCKAKGYRFIRKKDFKKVIKELLHIGDQVTFERNKQRYSGIVLSVDPLIIKTKERIFFKVSFFDLFIKDVPVGLVFMDHLELLQKDINRCQINYLTGGIGWRSTYVAKLGHRLHLQGYIKINNSSGSDYHRVKLKVLAGDLRQSVVPVRRAMVIMDAAMAKPAVQQHAVAGYHRYDIDGVWDLPDGQEVSILYIDEDLPYKKKLIANCSDLSYNFGTRKYRFDQVVEFKAPKPLPGGNVRFYADGTFLGQSTMANRAEGEKVELTTGKHFDLLLTKQTLEFEDRKNFKQIKVRYIISNPTNKDQKLFIKEHLFGNAHISTTQNYKKQDASTIVYNLVVPAKSKKSFTAQYTFYK